MSPKIRNIIIFIAIGIILVLIYFFFFSSPTPQDNLVSTTLPNAIGGSTTTDTTGGTPSTAGDFLTLLLNVQNIKLNDAIFSDPAFNSLHDSSIMLIPDNTQGRPNPFAQFGNDVPAMPNIPNVAAPATPVSVTPVPATPAPTTTKPATTKP